jgi:MYXO-CTERM domain-containing protein
MGSAVAALRLAASALVACAAADPGVAVSTAPIIGGTTDTGKDPAVTLVRIFDEQHYEIATCSGILITPRVVMTAAHCASGRRGDASYTVAFTDTYDPHTEGYTGLLGERGVLRRWVDPSFNLYALGDGYDLALLLLDAPAPQGIPPLPIDRTRVVAPGTPVRMVGFGMTQTQNASNVRSKQTAESHVTALQTVLFNVDGTAASPCNGDSGGPALAVVDGTEVVSGLVSFGDTNCDTLSTFTFVSRLIWNVDAFVMENDPDSYGVCGADGACGFGCAQPDPDCPCAADGTCNPSCPDIDLDPDCPIGCRADGICVRAGCPMHDPDCLDLPLGSSCTGPNDCTSGACAADGNGGSCVPVCDGNGTCPAGYQCAAPENFCLPVQGGCAVGGGGDGAWLVLLVGLGLHRRRRRVVNA